MLSPHQKHLSFAPSSDLLLDVVNKSGGQNQYRGSREILHSAKKPIKVRSVLQPNGLRHFIVNEEAHEDIYDIKSLLHNQQQRRNNNKTSSTVRPSTHNEGDAGSSSNDNGVLTQDYNNKERINSDSWALPRSITLNDASSPEENGSDFFGVSGSKIYNSKKHKGQHSRYLHQFPHTIKTSVEISRYPTVHLDLIPVKSPVIKQLINGRIDSGNPNLLKNQRSGQQGGTSTSTTLCSRIMTWIDLEVKRNSSSGGKGKSSSSGNGSSTLPYCSADLSIINELYEYQSKLDAFSSSPSSSSDRSSTSSSISGDGASSSCSSSTSSSSSVSLPKLIPCWRKEGSNINGVGVGGNKAKKSVRIAEDLPRWGKMKRRLRRRTLSLNELYDDDEQPLSLKSPLPSRSNYSIYNNNDRSRSSSNKTDYYGGSSSSKLSKSKKEYSSVSDLMEERCSNLPKTQGGSTLDLLDFRCNESPEKETDSFTVCDERLPTSGKVQVHIFLPQTDSAGNRVGGGGDVESSAGNLSARSEDSTS